MTRFARRLHRHYWLSALLLGCLVLRAFVPSGYMLDTAGGDLGLKMCSGTTLAVPSTDHGSNEGPGDAHQGSCPAGLPLLALAYALTLTAEAPAIVSAPPAANNPARSSIPPSPSRLPRGPPTHLA